MPLRKTLRSYFHKADHPPLATALVYDEHLLKPKPGLWPSRPCHVCWWPFPNGRNGATPAFRPYATSRFLTRPERRRERPAGGRHVRRAGRAWSSPRRHAPRPGPLAKTRLQPDLVFALNDFPRKLRTDDALPGGRTHADHRSGAVGYGDNMVIFMPHSAT